MNEIYDKESYEDFMNELMLDEYLMEKAMEKEEIKYDWGCKTTQEGECYFIELK